MTPRLILILSVAAIAGAILAASWSSSTVAASWTDSPAGFFDGD